MDTYPCPACGGVSDDNGCRSCRRAHDPVAASLARVNEALAGLDTQSQRLAEDQSELQARRARLQAQRVALANAISERLVREGGSSETVPPQRAGPSSHAGGLGRQAGGTGARAGPPHQPAAPAETSPRSAQNTLLTLGGVLLAIAAVVFTGLFFSAAPTGGRVAILGLATTLALVVPVVLARRTLTATAETIAGLGLLLVLLDGYAAYGRDLAGVAGLAPALYAAILFAMVAVVAAAYRLVTHLRAPQFAALLASQPLLPLVGMAAHTGRDGFAAVFALVAAQNLGAIVLLSREWRQAPGLPARRPPWPRMLREVAWSLCGVALAASVILASVGLARAGTVTAAAQAAVPLVLAAAVGIGGGVLTGRPVIRDAATGAATLAVIAAVSRVDALAIPRYTLVLTAALATATALVARLLPVEQRRGPQVGSLVAAAGAAVVVVAGALVIAVAAVRASTTPAVWAADLTGYATRVLATSWQVPAAALLIAALATAAVPRRWRVDAATAGTCAVVLAAPATGQIAWWAVPVLGVAASAGAFAAAIGATVARSAVIRSAIGGCLCLYAMLTSLARPALTAAISAAVAVIGVVAVAVAVRWPQRIGPYADRAADLAGGAAALTLPVAVGTYAWLAGAPPGVLVPLTVLAGSAGVLGAALSRASAPATAGTAQAASAAGAVAAAAGCVLLAIKMPATPVVDLGLAAALLAGAAATVAGANPAQPTGSAQRAGSAEAETAVRRRWIPQIGGASMGAALATAAAVLAMARLLAVAVPGIGLVTNASMVFVVSIAGLALPEPLRAGPRLGAATVGGALALVSAGVALAEAGRALMASTPFWAADIGAWRATVSGWAPYAWQVPASLLLAAAAAWALLPTRVGGVVGFLTLALAWLAAPAALGLAWWSPIAIGGALAVAAGFGAALVGPDEPASSARQRLVLAGGLGLYAAAASAATPAATAVYLSFVVVAGGVVAAVAQRRFGVPPGVAGVAAGASLLAAPGAVATIALASGAGRSTVLIAAMAAAAVGVLVLTALRAIDMRWTGYPALAVGLAALVIALAALVHPGDASVWAALAALIGVAAAATLLPDRPGVAAVITATAAPAAVLAAIGSAPAWLTALVGPYRTLRHVWHGYELAPAPRNAGPAVATLLVLAVAAAAAALAVGGRGYLLTAVLPPLAALVLVAPTAVGAARGVTPWVALAVALVAGLGATLSRVRLRSAARMLRVTAGVICALSGGAGLAGALATRAATLAALSLLVLTGAAAASLGRDPVARTVAWVVASAAALALPVTLAAGQQLRSAAFGLLGVCAVLTATAWVLARTPQRRTEAGTLEGCIAVGAALALALAVGSARHAAAVLTVWGLLIGAAALRRDRSAASRQWLVRAALGAEIGACWLLLYVAAVGLPEAYTLPFAAVALAAGALELRRRPDLSSWVAYGPALAGGFLPSFALVLVGQDPVGRWVTLFGASVVTVIIGSWRRRRAPVVAGAATAVAVAVTEMVRLLIHGAIAGALLVGLAGVVLIVLGALAERRLRTALGRMS